MHTPEWAFEYDFHHIIKHMAMDKILTPDYIFYVYLNQSNKQVKFLGGICGVLNKNGPHRLTYLNA